MIVSGNPRLDRMRAVLRALPAWQRQALTLFHVDNKSDTEIASLVEKTQAEVHAGIAAARELCTKAVRCDRSEMK